MSAATLTVDQVQMRQLYSALRRSRGRGMLRSELVTATGLTRAQVRKHMATMVRERWVYAAQQVVNGKAQWRYATCPKHWK